MDKKYWKKYYETHADKFKPSTFARHITGKYLRNVDHKNTIIDLGCGNGRDSMHFSQTMKVIALDQCENIIEHINNYDNINLVGIADDLGNLSIEDEVEYAYSRFSLHSISEEAESELFQWVKENVTKSFFIETRSDYDKLQVAKTNHYRRFINMEKLIIKLLSYGFKIEYAEYSDKFATYEKVYDQDENLADINPRIIRIVCNV